MGKNIVTEKCVRLLWLNTQNFGKNFQHGRTREDSLLGLALNAKEYGNKRLL